MAKPLGGPGGSYLFLARLGQLASANLSVTQSFCDKLVPLGGVKGGPINATALQNIAATGASHRCSRYLRLGVGHAWSHRVPGDNSHWRRRPQLGGRSIRSRRVAPENHCCSSISGANPEGRGSASGHVFGMKAGLSSPFRLLARCFGEPRPSHRFPIWSSRKSAVQGS
jgi:hypothetical protein